MASPGRPLDVLFIQDFTGSQQPFIDAAHAEIRNICATLTQQGNFAPGDLKFGLVAYRDHPPQAKSFVTKALTPHSTNHEQVAFTTDPGIIANMLSTLEADEGGDGPEAVADAFQMGLRADWRGGASKVAILITDAPPHGIGEEGDKFPDGCPLHIDPLRMASSMANAGITLHVIACEPDLSRCYDRARSFYEGLVKKTGGRVLDLGDTTNLPRLILGTILETLDHEAIVTRNLNAVQYLVDQDNDASNEMIARELHIKLRAENVKMRTVDVEHIVPQDSKASQNVQAWFEAESIEEGRVKIQDVAAGTFTSRFISEAPQPPPTIETKDISLSQVEGIVQKARMRNRPVRV